MRHLFVTDLDGTLLGSDSRVSPRSAAIISDLTARGALVTVATARTPATVEPLLAHTRTTIPAIVMTGSAMWDRAAGRYIHPHLLPEATAMRAFEAFRAEEVNPFVYVLGDDGILNVWHPLPLNKWEDGFYQERRTLALKRFHLGGDDAYTLYRPGTVLLFTMAPYEAVCRVAARLQDDPGMAISCYRDIFNHEAGCIEVLAGGLSKANALLKLKEHLGADRVTVYGDNLNDLSMMAVADESVAVANAVPEVLAKASRVIGPNTADAVALDILNQFDKLS